MKMKVIAGFAFLLNTMLFATYYAVAKEALGRIDPIVFTFFEMITLAPIALAILVFTYQHLTWALIKRGVLLGSCLCLALFTIAIALKYSTATGTAFFPALNGCLAALIAWLVLRQPMNKATWIAGILSVAGTVLLVTNSQMGGARGAVIAFLGGIFFTLYVFLSDYGTQELEKHKTLVHWPLLAIELLTMSLWACLIALLFGDWQAFHPSFPKDVYVILYVAGACTFLPTLIAVLMQKHVSAVTVSFIYILEPVLGVIAAHFYLHEVLPFAGYLGGGLVVMGAFIHTLGSVKRVEHNQQELVQEQRVEHTIQPFMVTVFSSYLSPLLYCCSGFLILYGLGGFPPLAWRELAPLAPIMLDWLHPESRAMASAILHTLLQGPQRQSFLLLLVQALCWLIGWSVLAILVCIALFHVLMRGKVMHSEKGDIYVGSGESMTGVNLVTTVADFHVAEPRDVGSMVMTGLAPVMFPTNVDDFVPNNAIWEGSLDDSTLELFDKDQDVYADIPLHEPWFHSTPEITTFNAQYDIQDVTTDELSPIMPILSMPTSQRSEEYYQYAAYGKLVEYVE